MTPNIHVVGEAGTPRQRLPPSAPAAFTVCGKSVRWPANNGRKFRRGAAGRLSSRLDDVATRSSTRHAFLDDRQVGAAGCWRRVRSVRFKNYHRVCDGGNEINNGRDYYEVLPHALHSSDTRAPEPVSARITQTAARQAAF